VAIVKVPLTVALVPDAVFEKLKVADPVPPLIWSSSFSVSSIMISIGILHITQLRMRGPITPASQAKFELFCPVVKSSKAYKGRVLLRPGRTPIGKQVRGHLCRLVRWILPWMVQPSHCTRARRTIVHAMRTP